MEQEAGPSSFKTPQNEQSEWTTTTSSSSSTTPSRQTFPRRLSLRQNDTSSPVARDDARRTSFTGPKPLSLGSQSVVTTPTTASGSGFDTPRRGKRTSLSYISSPSTSVKAAETDAAPLSRAPSTSSASGRTRTGSISRAATGSGSRRRPSQTSDADDWLMSEDDASFSLPSATRAMAERDSAKVEAQFHDTGYREGITAGKLSTLQNGFDTGFNENGHTRHARTSNSGSLDSTSAADPTSTSSVTLLRLIAEKERRVFELREELSTTENQLSQLRTTWQRLATRELGLPAPSISSNAAFGGEHRRDGGVDSVADAWGSLKLGLNNILESIANPPPAGSGVASRPPPTPEKDAAGGGGGGASGLLRPSGALGVLEEEGSDLGSGAVSPRSPRSPSAPAPAPLDDTKMLLGFSVDSNGLAHLAQEEERGPPTPPKTEQIPTSGKWTSRRTSMLGSLSSLQSKLTDVAGGSDGGAGGGWLAKRFKEAQANASELLREAERKLGDAMNLDDLLGASQPASRDQRATSPRIELEEASVDDSLNAHRFNIEADPPRRSGESSWYQAAGGLPRRSSESRSPNLNPADTVGRLSISSSSSRGSTKSLEVPNRKGATSPNMPHSPPVGGAPGSAGVFGLFMGRDGSSTDLTAKNRASGDWGWAEGEANDDDT